MGHDGFNTATNGSGNKVANVNLDVNYFVPQLACSSDIKVLGGFLGWNTIVPFSEQDSGVHSRQTARVSAIFWWGHTSHGRPS